MTFSSNDFFSKIKVHNSRVPNKLFPIQWLVVFVKYFTIKIYVYCYLFIAYVFWALLRNISLKRWQPSCMAMGGIKVEPLGKLTTIRLFAARPSNVRLGRRPTYNQYDFKRITKHFLFRKKHTFLLLKLFLCLLLKFVFILFYTLHEAAFCHVIISLGNFPLILVGVKLEQTIDSGVYPCVIRALTYKSTGSTLIDTDN